MSDGFLVPEPGEEILRRRGRAEDGGPRPLIRGLLHRKLTLIYGLATGGKTTWAYNLANAYLEGGGEFMGQPVHVPEGPKRVAFITTDDDGEDDAVDAMHSFGKLDRIGVYGFGLQERGRSLDAWYEAGVTLVERGYGLVFVDNAGGLLRDDESTNDDPTARAVISRMRVLVRAGLSVALLTHSNRSGTFGGAEEWRKVARYIHGIYGKVPKTSRTVQTSNNKDNLPKLTVLLDGKGPGLVKARFTPPSEGAPAEEERGPKRSDEEYLAEMQARGDWKTQAEIAEVLGVAPSTVTRILSRTRHTLVKGSVVPKLRAA